MKTDIIVHILIATMLILTTIGCDEDENRRLAEMAEKHLERQAEQNRRMSELQHEVAEGSRPLVEADARSREEMVALQREVQAERSEFGRQRDALENERRHLAAKRRLDPIIAAAITNVGLIIVCVLPLILCWHLLHRPPEPADDTIVAEVLLEDLVAKQPLLIPHPEEHPAISFQDADDGHVDRTLPAS